MASDPRPTRNDPAIIAAAARKTVDALIKGGHLEADDLERSVVDLTKHARPWMDGYEIAKALDTSAYWDCDFGMVEILDGFMSEIWDALRDAESEWAARTKPQPPHAVGSRIRLRSGETGEITGIYEHGAAKYLVRIDDDPHAAPPHHSRRVVDFEDALAPEVA